MTTRIQTTLTHTSSRTARVSALTLAMLLMQSNMAMAAAVVSNIQNTAKVSYSIDNKTNTVISYSSNTVQINASTPIVYGLSLSQAVLKTVSPGALASWTNVLKNTSTDEATINLSLIPDQTLSNLKVYQDLNNNGIVDEGDREIILNNLSAQIKMQQAESIQFIVQALVSKEAQDGDTANIKLNATILEDPSISAASAIDSAIVVAPRIDFMDDIFSEFKQKSQVDENIYIQAGYAECNVQSEQKDQVWVTITSQKTGDTYSLKGIETGNNTGKYRLEAPTELNANAINDKIIQTLDGDSLTAKLEACIAPSVGLDPSQLPTNDADFGSRIEGIDNQISIFNEVPNLLVIPNPKSAINFVKLAKPTRCSACAGFPRYSNFWKWYY